MSRIEIRNEQLLLKSIGGLHTGIRPTVATKYEEAYESSRRISGEK